VLLIGEEQGLVEAAAEHHVPLLSDVERNDSGTPLVNSIFSLASHTSQSPFLVYVNADILLLPDIIDATQQVQINLKTRQPKQLETEPASLYSEKQFLMIGQRWDLEVSRPIDFSPGWDQRLREEVRTSARLHRPAGSDYFVYPRSAFTKMPEFAIGRAGWDNWMIFHARQQGWPVIDATQSVMIVHQNHDYSHLPGGAPHYDLDESQHNTKLAGGLAHMYMVLDANQQLVNGRLQKPHPSPERLIRSLERRLMPKDGNLRSTRGWFTRRLRRMRRKIA